MTYFMRGVFEQNGEEHPQVGVFNIHLDNTVAGSVMGFNLVYDIKGELTMVDDVWCLDFILEPHGGCFWKGISARYQLKKSDDVKQVGGRYEGHYEHTKGGFPMSAELASRIVEGKENKARLTLDTMV